jgi:hypothetical protein
MCFVGTPNEQTADPNAGADAAQSAELNRRRRAQGYGASLLTPQSGLTAPTLGRVTLGGQ